MDAPKYEVWIADLNTLYDDCPRSAVFAEDCWTMDEAIRAVNEFQYTTTAAWIQDKESGAIITNIYAPPSA